MVEFLTDDWFAQLHTDVGKGDGTPSALDTVSIEVTVLQAPAGDITWHVELSDGSLAASAGGRPGADVAITVPYDDAVRVLRGEVAPSVLFMRGTMKTAGDPGLLLDVLEVTASPAFAAAREQVRDRTDV